MNQQILMTIPGISSQEMMFINEAIKELTDEQQKNLYFETMVILIIRLS